MINWLCKKFNMKYVFCYHRILPKESAQAEMVHRALYVTPQTFEKHILWMKKVGNIVSKDHIFTRNQKPTFIITFDDGWRDNLQYAFPILKKYNVPAIIFVSSNNINTNRVFWSEEIGLQIKRSSMNKEAIISILKFEIKQIINKKNNLIRIPYDENSSDILYLLDRMIECLKRLPFSQNKEILDVFYERLGVPLLVENHNILLTWDELSFLSAQGVDIGSHTHTHALLDRVDNDTIDYELLTSKNIIEEKINKEINMFSYPNGSFKNSYIKISLKKHGYKYAFTLEREPIINYDPYIIPRCLVYEDLAYSIKKYFLYLLLKFIRPSLNKYIVHSIQLPFHINKLR
jgi:peptidoglycan/xylan/chitin deacetylase (PgdA/CDA1 family)